MHFKLIEPLCGWCELAAVCKYLIIFCSQRQLFIYYTFHNFYERIYFNVFMTAGYYFYATYYDGTNHTDPGGMADFRESAWSTTYDLYQVQYSTPTDSVAF